MKDLKLPQIQERKDTLIGKVEGVFEEHHRVIMAAFSAFSAFVIYSLV